jgi:single-strand DNA-binding protein
MRRTSNLTTLEKGAGVSGSQFLHEKRRNMNHVNLIGKMSSSPKYYELPNGRRVAQFTLSTNEVYLDEHGKTKKKSHQHRMAAWGKWVQVLEQLGNVGMELAIEGKLISRFYERSGEKHFVSEVEINDLIIL